MSCYRVVTARMAGEELLRLTWDDHHRCLGV